MKKYIVVADVFKDVTNKHIYKKDHDFPFDDSEISEKRLNELLTANNKMGIILIAEKKLEQYSLKDLKIIASEEKINIENLETESDIIKRIKKERIDKSKVIQKLTEKGIEFDSNSSLKELRDLFKNEK